MNGNKNIKRCSECSSNDHTFRDCKEQIKKCLNCQGNHSTLAMKCPIKREIIAKKKEEMNNQKNTNKTFAQATEQSTPQNSITNLEIGNETPAKILTCLLHAHVMNAVEPGVFNKEANEL